MPHERAATGMFLGFQYPVEIPGVSNVQFLRTALNAQRRARGEAELSAGEFLRLAREQADALGLDMEMMKRAVNVGFSGGEKKRNEMVQMGIIDPRLAILDETDSGLDIDALRVVGEGINRIMRKPDKAVLLITHYQRLLDLVEPDFVHVLAGGRIVRSGGARARPRARARRLWSEWRRDPARPPLEPRRSAGAGATFRRCRRSPRRSRRDACRTRCPGSTASTRAAAAVRRRRLDESRSRLGPVEIGPVAVETGHPLAASPAAPAGAPPRPRPCAAGPRPDRPCLDRRRRPSRRRDRARRGRPGLGRRDLHRRRLDQPADRHRARQERAADAEPARCSATSGFVSLTDRAELGEGASLVSATLAAGGRDTRLDGEIVLDGEGAFAEAGGALLARGRQRHDANLVIRHAAPNGTSRQIWRSVADDKAACSVAARVEVARDAQKTDGEQSLKGLLLARSATINAKPELEIFADDVKCAHGATVGELDRSALFYLESRGVAPDEAEALLTRAFVADALDRIGEEEVREAFYADAEGWFA